MSNREYIESGILEAYALGMLPAEEAQEVEEKAMADPEIKKALEEAQSTTEDLAQAHSVTPPPEWKSSILEAAKGSSPDQEDEPRVRSLQEKEQETGKKDSPTNWLAVAATVVLLLSLGVNVVQYRNMDSMKDQLLDMQLRLANLEIENDVMVANYREMEENLAVLRDPSTATFVMKGVEGKSQTLRADVFWNAKSEEVFLDVKNLPEPPSGKQYQLWAMRGGQPVDMGVFQFEDNVVMKDMGQIPGADAFAITLEPAGGSPQPTIDQMYVYGEPLAI